ncbi:putative HTLV-1-related endogenous sequence [Meriones unguiculatus]|uniref:putative HTLV-1-related endogenous sequence n=1 Tax=Meriones unguiculatus TaxID=10047 RepID=UPI000B4F5344|nr:putative HTLV-1-related endogenous sequence [Meriones unguiculatus]
MALREETGPRRRPRPAPARPAPSAPPLPRPRPTHPRRTSPAPPRSPGRAPRARRSGEGRPARPARGPGAWRSSRTPPPQPGRPRGSAPAPRGLRKLSPAGEGGGLGGGRAREVGGHPRGISGRRPPLDTLGRATCGSSAAWAEESVQAARDWLFAALGPARDASARRRRDAGTAAARLGAPSSKFGDLEGAGPPAAAAALLWSQAESREAARVGRSQTGSP